MHDFTHLEGDITSNGDCVCLKWHAVSLDLMSERYHYMPTQQLYWLAHVILVFSG